MQAVSSSHAQSVRYRARGQASARDSTSDVFFDVAAAAATALTAAVATRKCLSILLNRAAVMGKGRL